VHFHYHSFSPKWLLLNNVFTQNSFFPHPGHTCSPPKPVDFTTLTILNTCINNIHPCYVTAFCRPHLLHSAYVQSSQYKISLQSTASYDDTMVLNIQFLPRFGYKTVLTSQTIETYSIQVRLLMYYS
jgi:hypothetical protein